MAAALGLEREYPDRLPISEQLNDRGLAMRDEMVNACTNGILRGRRRSQRDGGRQRLPTS